MLTGHREEQASPPRAIWGLLQAVGWDVSPEVLLMGMAGWRVSVGTQGLLCTGNNLDAKLWSSRITVTKAEKDRVDTARADQCLYYAVETLCEERCGNPGAVKVRIFTEFLGNCVCL